MAKHELWEETLEARDEAWNVYLARIDTTGHLDASSRNFMKDAFFEAWQEAQCAASTYLFVPDRYVSEPILTNADCGHCWRPNTQGDACPLCAANKHSDYQEIRIAELEETVLSQALRLSRLDPEPGA